MRSIAVLLLALSVAACSRAHAKTSPQTPALDVPLLPEHDVEPTETDAPEPVPLPQEPARNTPPRLRPAPPREPPRAEPPRTEPPKPESPPTPADVKPEETPRPAAPLQTMPTTAEGDAERAIRSTLQRASTDLSRVDYRVLNSDARNQYDTAKRIIRQAEDNIRSRNLVFAKTLADKASQLAAQLAAR